MPDKTFLVKQRDGLVSEWEYYLQSVGKDVIMRTRAQDGQIIEKIKNTGDGFILKINDKKLKLDYSEVHELRILLNFLNKFSDSEQHISIEEYYELKG